MRRDDILPTIEPTFWRFDLLVLNTTTTGLPPDKQNDVRIE